MRSEGALRALEFYSGIGGLHFGLQKLIGSLPPPLHVACLKETRGQTSTVTSTVTEGVVSPDTVTEASEGTSRSVGRTGTASSASGAAVDSHTVTLGALPPDTVTAEVLASFDINDCANDVYEWNFGRRPRQTNIQTLTERDLDRYRAHLWLMSPPCQPYTRQGLKKDCHDKRATSFLSLIHLLPRMRHPPSYLLLENVQGFESSETAGMLRELLRSCGFHLWECLLSPLHLALPYSRPRYFCLARREPFCPSLHSPSSPCPFHCSCSHCIGRPDTLPSHSCSTTTASRSQDVTDCKPSHKSREGARSHSAAADREPELLAVSSSGVPGSSGTTRDSGTPGYSCTPSDRVTPGESGTLGDSGTPRDGGTPGGAPVAVHLDAHPHTRVLLEFLDQGGPGPCTSLVAPSQGLQSTLLSDAERDAPHSDSAGDVSGVISGDISGCREGGSDGRGHSDSYSDCQSDRDSDSQIGSDSESGRDSGIGSGSGRDEDDEGEGEMGSECRVATERCSDAPNGSAADSRATHDGATNVSATHSSATNGISTNANATNGSAADSSAPEDLWKEFRVPMETASRFASCIDVVEPDSQRCCCFTKSYSRYAKGTGSMLRAAAGEELRYFTPREVARLHSFPETFTFPPHVTLKQRYALLGNSVSVEVVKQLLGILLFDTSDLSGGRATRGGVAATNLELK